MYRLELISKLEILPGVEKGGSVKKCAINSRWELADSNHPNYDGENIIIIDKQNNWLKFTKEDINNFFEIRIR